MVKQEDVLSLLGPYTSLDDKELYKDEFLRMVHDRIAADLDLDKDPCVVVHVNGGVVESSYSDTKMTLYVADSDMEGQTEAKLYNGTAFDECFPRPMDDMGHEIGVAWNLYTEDTNG